MSFQLSSELYLLNISIELYLENTINTVFLVHGRW